MKNKRFGSRVGSKKKNNNRNINNNLSNSISKIIENKINKYTTDDEEKKEISKFMKTCLIDNSNKNTDDILSCILDNSKKLSENMLYVIYDTCYEICKDLNKLPSYFEFEEYRKIINEKLVNMSRTDKNKNLNGGGHPLVMEPGGLVWFLYLVMIYVLIVVNTPSFVINSQIKLLRDEFARIPDRANKWEEERQKLIKMRGEHVDIGPAPIEMWQKTLMKAIKEKENELQRVQSSFYEKHQWWKRET